MKISILSMQRIVNSGSFLQAYALKKVIESLGHKVNFIDINVTGISMLRRIKNFSQEYCRWLIVLICYALVLLGKKKYISPLRTSGFYHDYKKKYEKSLGLSKELRFDNYDGKTDVVVVGSDEVFNIIQYLNRGENIPWNLYGEGLKTKKIISYAASCGHTTYDQVVEQGIEKKAKDLLENFSSFSVRDGNTADYISKITNRKAEINIDPVLLYEFDADEIKVPKYSDYILLYGYSNRIIEPDEIKAIRDFASKVEKKIICVNFSQYWCDEYILVSPLEVLGYFKYASYVITDTFHGAVMSIKYQRKFATYIRDNNKQKLEYLLRQFELESRVITLDNTLDKILNTDIDSDKIKHLLDNYQNEAINYLKRNLSD